MELCQPGVKKLLEPFNIRSLSLVQLSLEVGLHGGDLVLREAGGTEVSSAAVLASAGQENSPADLTENTAQIGSQLAGV